MKQPTAYDVKSKITPDEIDHVKKCDLRWHLKVTLQSDDLTNSGTVFQTKRNALSPNVVINVNVNVNMRFIVPPITKRTWVHYIVHGIQR